MKKLTFALLLVLLSVSAKAQLYQYAKDEPASTLQIEYTENPDSLFIFLFTSDKGVPYEVPATGAYWRNGDFITIAPLGAWLEVSYRIIGSVQFRKLKKQ